MTFVTKTFYACVRWYWIRHASVQGREGVFTGSSDIPANLEDSRTAIASLASLLPQHPDLWISSTLKRARQTTHALQETPSAQRGCGQTLEEQALNEQDFGDWEGERYDEVRHRALWDAPATHRPPKEGHSDTNLGESFQDLARRVAHAVERIERTHCCIGEGRENTLTIVAVAHAGTIRAALAQALRLPLPHALSFTIDPLSLTRIDRYRHCRQDEQKADTKADTVAAVHCVNLQQRQEDTEATHDRA